MKIKIGRLRLSINFSRSGYSRKFCALGFEFIWGKEKGRHTYSSFKEWNSSKKPVFNRPIPPENHNPYKKVEKQKWISFKI